MTPNRNSHLLRFIWPYVSLGLIGVWALIAFSIYTIVMMNFEALVILALTGHALTFYSLDRFHINEAKTKQVMIRADRFYWRYRSVTGLNRQLISFRRKA